MGTVIAPPITMTLSLRTLSPGLILSATTPSARTFTATHTNERSAGWGGAIFVRHAKGAILARADASRIG